MANAFDALDGLRADDEMFEDEDPINLSDDEIEVGEAEEDSEFDKNLAETMSEDELSTISSDLALEIKADIDSRDQWEVRQKKGLQFLGIEDLDTAGRPDGSSHVSHPLMMEALVQFQARAIEEAFPAQGPVKGLVMGDITDEREEQRARVEGYMNYHLTTEDVGYFEDLESMLMAMPWQGSCFRKVYRDDIKGLNTSRYITAENIIAPFDAKSERDAERITQRFTLSANSLKKLQQSGIYRDIELAEASSDSGHTFSDLDGSRLEASGISAIRAQDDSVYTLFECHCDLDLDEDSDGIAIPYIVTMEEESETILAIRRNWEADDDKKVRIQSFVQFKYLPGFGFYGFGLPHIIGGLSAAATETLRSLLDSATFANFQGGFKSKDSAIKTGEFSLKMGTWQEVDATAEDLQKTFYTPPFKEPSQAMFGLLGILQDLGRRFASTTESMVGAGDNRGPVGTTLALIEQGSKIYTGIHKRMHVSQGQEFRLLSKLHGEYMPEGGYPYAVPGANREIFAEDFDEIVDVVPVSDPNIISQAQRIAIAQGVMELASSQPALYDMEKVHRRMLTAMRVPDLDDILMKAGEVQPADPITENMAIMVGKPIKAFEYEDHQAHMAAHVAFLEHPQFGGHPQAAQIVGPPMIAHLAEHLAFQYKKNHEDIGVPVLPVNLDAEQGEPLTIPDPQLQDQTAKMAAQAVEQFKQTMGIATQPQPQEPDKAAMAEQLHQANMKARTESHQLDMQQDAEKHQMKMQQDAEDHQQEVMQAAELFKVQQGIKQADQKANTALKAVDMQSKLERQDEESAAKMQGQAAKDLGDDERAEEKSRLALQKDARKATLDLGAKAEAAKIQKEAASAKAKSQPKASKPKGN